MDNKKFHICFIGHKFPLTNKVLDQASLWPIAEKLASMGNKVSIITHKNPYGTKVLKKENCTIHFTSSQNKFISVQNFPKVALNKIAELHKTEHIDHVHSLDTLFTKYKSSFDKKAPTLSYGTQASSMEEMFSLFGVSHDNLKNILKTHFIYPFHFIKSFFSKEYFSLKQAQGFFVNSPKEALALERYYLYPPKKIFQIPIASYISNLSERKVSLEVLEELGLKEQTPVIATSSDMTRSYEMFFLLDVFEQVALSNPKAKLLILGKGPQFKQIERQVLLKALDQKVIFAKNISINRLSEYISVSDVFVNINSKTSGFGPTLMEAMAQGKIIIGSEFSPISNIIETGKNGFLIRPGETMKCAKLIDSVFAGIIDKSSIGAQAKEDISKVLDLDTLTEKTLKTFKKIHSGKSSLFS